MSEIHSLLAWVNRPQALHAFFHFCYFSLQHSTVTAYISMNLRTHSNRRYSQPAVSRRSSTCNKQQQVSVLALVTLLQDREFRCCLCYWLGVPLLSSTYSCPECGGDADRFGDHQVGCGGNGDRISRHNALRDVLFTAAQSAALSPAREASGVVPDSLSRPADILLPTWSQGRPAALDIHVISPLQQQTVHGAASTPGHALQVGVQRKLTSHLSACRSAGVTFIPVVAEALGGLAEDTISIIKSFGESIAQRAAPFDSTACTKQLFRRFAITLWRGNSVLWLRRLPTFAPSVDGVI